MSVVVQENDHLPSINIKGHSMVQVSALHLPTDDQAMRLRDALPRLAPFSHTKPLQFVSFVMTPALAGVVAELPQGCDCVDILNPVFTADTDLVPSLTSPTHTPLRKIQRETLTDPDRNTFYRLFRGAQYLSFERLTPSLDAVQFNAAYNWVYIGVHEPVEQNTLIQNIHAVGGDVVWRPRDVYVTMTDDPDVDIAIRVRRR